MGARTRKARGTRRAARTIYGGKDPKPRSFTLTPLAHQILDAAQARAGTSASNVVEHLLRRHGGEVTAADFERGDHA